MKYNHILILSLFIWGIVMNAGCSSQTPKKQMVYPACEPRSNTDPGRLTVRAGAEDFGMTAPCTVNFELYINPNSEIRSLHLDLEFTNEDDDLVHQEKIRAFLEKQSTGMFQKEVSAEPVEGESCRTLQIAIQSVACYAADGSVSECPDIRIIPPDAVGSLRVDDTSVTVCSGGS